MTRIAGFWHNPGLPMTKTELQSALAEATQTDKRTAGVFLDTLSDIAYKDPSEEILVKLADVLDVSPDELKQYDTRGPIADLKRLVDSDPKLGFAFRTVVEKIKNGELTAEDIIAKLSKRKSRA
jgi:hypothetical protein